MPEALDAEQAERALKSAPEAMRRRLEEIGGKADDRNAAWRTDPNTRRAMLSSGLHIGALAVSFGATGVGTVREKVDSAKLVIVALQQFAIACGYERVAEKLRTRYVERLEGNAVVFKRGSAGQLAVHAPFSGTWNDWCRGHRQFFTSFEKLKGFFFRHFYDKHLGEVVNALAGCFGDVIAIDPDGNMVALPSMSIETEKPAPAENVKADDVKVVEEVPSYAVPDRVKLGDRIRLKSGREEQILWIDPTRQLVGLGKKPGGGYALFMSFNEVKEQSGKEIAAELYKEKTRYSASIGDPTPTPQPSAKSTVRPIPVLADGSTLDPHQVVGVQWIDEHNGRAILADEMGLGKSIVGGVCIDAPAVVVCPANLKMNWNREIMKWRPGLTTTVIEGGKDPGEVAKKADVVILNYQIVEKHLEWLTKRGNVTVVADEAQALKNMDVRWDKADQRFAVKPPPQLAKAFYELQRGVRRIILMTGTPIMNRTKEIFPLLHMVDPKEWKSGFDFCTRYCGGHYERFGPREVFVCDGRTNSEELFNRINDKFMLRRTAAVLNLPPKRYEPITVSMDEKSATLYKTQVKEFLAWVSRMGGPEAVLRAERAEALVKLNALRQTVAVGKVEAAVDFIKRHWESKAAPLVVMANFQEVFTGLAAGIDALNAEYRQQQREGETPDMQAPIRYAAIVGGMASTKVLDIVDKFQRGELDVVLYSIALAVGTTLTKAQDMLFVERAWRPADLAQAEARIFRRGQKNNCLFTYMDAEGTVDGKMAMLLKQKAGTIAAVIHGVNLEDEDAAALVLGEMFSVPVGVSKNPVDIQELVADSWGEPF